MTNEEAIETLKANYPDACFEQLREAVDMAIKALEQVNLANAEAEYWKNIALEYKSLIDKLSQCFNPDSKIEDLL